MKKIKLFTTIASLCLAVALMAFGVYAATSASIGVTSSITFSADGQVGGTLTVKSYSVASVAESGEIDLSQQTALENFTAIINATAILYALIRLLVNYEDSDPVRFPRVPAVYAGRDPCDPAECGGAFGGLL